MFSPFLILIISISATHAVSFCTSGRELCFDTTVQGNQMLFEVRKSSSASWVGIGFGRSMDDVGMVMLYDLNGAPVVSDRWSAGESRPTPENSQNLTVLSGTVPGLYRFTRPLKPSNSKQVALTSGNTNIVWAFAKRTFTSENNLPIHSNKGRSQIDLFSSASVVAGSRLDYNTVVVAHGVLMFIAWALLSTAGVFIARFLKARLGDWWFRAHAGLLALNAVFTIIAFILIVAVTANDHFENAHQVIGLIIFIFAVLQTILGVVINHLFDANRSTLPWHDQLHWWLGRLVMLLAVINIFLGIELYGENESVLMGLFGAFIVIVIGVFAVGQWKFGQTHHQSVPLNEYAKYEM